jgi:hypothetical protein
MRTRLSLHFGEMQGDFGEMQGSGKRNPAKGGQISNTWMIFSLLRATPGTGRLSFLSREVSRVAAVRQPFQERLQFRRKTMPEFVPSSYLSTREALNRLGRELFPSELTGKEHEARRGLISEDEWLRIKDLPPARGGDAPGSGPMMRRTKAPAVKTAPHSSDDPSDPLYQEEYRAGMRYMDARDRLRKLLEAGQLEAAILDP